MNKPVITVDNGNKNQKIVSSIRGKLLVPNAQVIYRPTKYENLTERTDEPLYELDVEIVRNGTSLGRYLYGNRAISSGAKTRGLAQEKYNADDILISALVGAALGLLDTKKPKNVKKDIVFGTLLPMHEYRDSEKVKHFQNRIAGTTQAIFRGPLFNDETVIEYTIKKEDLHIFPEGGAAVRSILTNEDGFKPEAEELLKRYKHLVMADLGGATFDIAAIKIEDGQIKITPVSDCLPYGILNAEKKMINRIRQEDKNNRVNLDPFYLDPMVRRREKKITINGKEIDIENIIETELTEIAHKEITDVLDIILTSEIEDVANNFILGLTGGANDVIFPIVEKDLKRRDIPFLRSDDPLFDNANGAYQQIMASIAREEELENITIGQAQSQNK